MIPFQIEDQQYFKGRKTQKAIRERCG